MNFDEWRKNPSGKGSAVMSSKQMYQDLYLKKFNNLVLKEGNKFKYTTYRTHDEYMYYIHIKVPSEVIRNFYYDTVIEFFTKDSAISVGDSLSKYDIRIFSNDPAFIFTHAHAYSKAKMFIEDLSSKVPKECLKFVAKERNPKDEIGYIKSVYFAYLIMKDYKLFSKINYKSAQIFKKSTFLDSIMHASDKIRLRQEAADKIRIQEKKERRFKQRQETESRNVAVSSFNNHPTTVGHTKVGNTVKTVGHTKTSHISKGRR